MQSYSDKEQFIEILKCHKGILIKIIRSYCREKDDWKDLEQEIIVQLWKSMDTYNNQYKFSTWIYRIALNVAISHYRKERNRPTKASLDEAVFVIEESSDVYDERRKILDQLIAGLDELNRALLILHLEDHNNKEIAVILGISESNVSTKLNRIRNRFKSSVQTNSQ